MVLEDRISFRIDQLIYKTELDARWPHATEAEIYDLHKQGKLRVFSYLKGPINGVLFCTPSSIGYWEDDYIFQYFDYYLMKDVLACEEQYPDFRGIIEATSHDMSDIENWGKIGCAVKEVDNIETVNKKTHWKDMSVIQDFASLPSISDSLCRNNLALAHDADGTICPPHLAALPLKIFFTEMPKPDEGDYYTSDDLMERYKLSPAELVNYLAAHEDLYPYGVPDGYFSSNHIMSKKIEMLDNASFHYRKVRSHEKFMQENGYYDKYHEDRQRRTIQNEVNPTDGTSRFAELEAQLAEAQKKIEDFEDVRRWNKQFLTERAELQSSLSEKDARIAELEKELASAKEKIAELSTTTRTQAATEARQGKVLDNWQAAFKIMIPVILQCHADGPKKRTKAELQTMCSKHGGELSTTQRDFLRECLKECLGKEHINTDGGAPSQS